MGIKKEIIKYSFALIVAIGMSHILTYFEFDGYIIGWFSAWATAMVLRGFEIDQYT